MADTSRRLAGVAYFTVDGVSCMLAGISVLPAQVKRETISGMDGVHGYKETPIPGFISATLRDAGSLSVAAFNAMTNVTVMIELANGKIVTARNAWTVTARGQGRGFDLRREVRIRFGRGGVNHEQDHLPDELVIELRKPIEVGLESTRRSGCASRRRARSRRRKRP
ncbi:phage tail tube protein [Azospirillum cavernae]|uniref:phage tail tube protein n=1 Tax=Azospirillum cavernae TaxID=2320860 RepID=UPI0018F5FBFD|nr:phage tail tube protein [Azospirillum cavernae]